MSHSSSPLLIAFPYMGLALNACIKRLEEFLSIFHIGSLFRDSVLKLLQLELD